MNDAASALASCPRRTATSEVTAMRKACYTLDLTEAVLLKDHLVQNGVGATVMNKGLVRIPYDGVASEIWVAEENPGEFEFCWNCGHAPTG